jgi:hypothetical protein
MAAFTALAIGLGLAGMASQAIGQHKAGDAAEAAGRAQADISESQAKVADFNAHVADLQSQDAIDRGAQAESRYRAQVKGFIGSQRAGFAASNVDVGFGSAVDVQADTAFTGELDALTIRNNAAREAWGYSVQSYDYQQQAAIDRKAAANQIAAGEQAKSASNFNIATTLLTGGSSLAMKYGFDRSSGSSGPLPSQQTVPNSTTFLPGLSGR